uniref:ARAD1A08514p n=1 Tax=Blastobotrys adeninivorans TaxID=409370 RepID=A0A060SXD5_BLAAD
MDSKSAQGKVDDQTLDVVVIGFADKISVMIYGDGRLGKLYYVPLSATVSQLHPVGMEDGPRDQQVDMFPLPHLTPMPLIGADSNDIQGRLYASQVASTISRQSPEEKRTVVIGLGPDIGPRVDEPITAHHRKQLVEVIRLVEQCRVW